MSEKTVIVIFSDPHAGGDEALGRLFNALFLVYELKERKREVELIFQGTGVRWVPEVMKSDHPAHDLYKSVEDKLSGVCGGCADVFGATESVEATGVKLIRQRDIPGTTGVLDLSQYIEAGSRLLIF